MDRKHLEWTSFIICVGLGVGGAVGQSLLLHNALVHSYPFKMMGMPPADFYAWIGNVGFTISLASAVIAGLFTKSLPRWLVVSIPVVVCPLVYWLVFQVTFLFSSFSAELMQERNFDGYTGFTARYEFGFLTLSLIFWGALIGIVLGFLLGKIFQILSRAVSSGNLK